MDVEELFRFKKAKGGYYVAEYLKKDDPSITELEIPGEYNGLPVVSILGCAADGAKYIKRVSIPGSIQDIMSSAFRRCSALEAVEFSEGLETIEFSAFAGTGLKSVKLPKSLTTLSCRAFWHCENLERVEFNSAPLIEPNVFSGCLKLPPETVVMGLENSAEMCDDCFRPDVFELLAKKNCFQDCNLKLLFERMMDEKPALFPTAEQYGLLEDAELLDTLTEYSAEQGKTEITSYLLDLKNRKFGFNGGNKFEL